MRLHRVVPVRPEKHHTLPRSTRYPGSPTNTSSYPSALTSPRPANETPISEFHRTHLTTGGLQDDFPYPALHFVIDLPATILELAQATPGRPLVARASAEVVDWLERGNPYLVDRLRRRIASEVQLVGEPAFPREKIDVGAVQ